MDTRRVVITGLGIISSNGIGKDAFSDALSKGTSGIKPISLFDVSGFKTKVAGEVKDFAPENFLGAKGLRLLDRSTKLVSCAVKLALEDTNLEISDENTHDMGVAIGTTFGSLKSISDFDREALEEGPQFVNPALFPNTVINSPASQVSIRFKIKGFNATISTGFSASLDAIGYALNFIKLGRIKIVLAGGVEELCIQTFLGFYKTGFLDNFCLGEGSGILVLEDLASAQNRKSNIYAEILGYDTSSACDKESLKRAMQGALKKAGAQALDIDFICAGANLGTAGDSQETQAIKDVFAKDKEKVYIKSMLGECFSAAGALGTIAAVLAIKNQDRQKVLINALGPCGSSSSLVISKFGD